MPPLATQSEPSEKARPRLVQSFDDLSLVSDSDLDVLVGAWLIARDVHPELALHSLQDELDRLAMPLIAGDVSSGSPLEQAEAMALHLYGHEGFSGNTADFYDPRNSLINDVLERKRGIPISLALVYVEVARRAGILASGVNFPGHFLVRIETGDTPVIVDPFNGGAVRDAASLEAMLRASSKAVQKVTDEHLSRAHPRTQLVRMLINLKWIYSTRGDRGRTLLTLSRLLSLTPDAAAALRERGILAEKLGVPGVARDDLSRLIALHPAAAKDEIVSSALKAAETRSPAFH